MLAWTMVFVLMLAYAQRATLHGQWLSYSCFLVLSSASLQQCTAMTMFSNLGYHGRAGLHAGLHAPLAPACNTSMHSDN